MISRLGFYKKVPEAWRIGYLVVFLLTVLSFCFVPAPALAEASAGEQIILTWSQDHPATSQTVTWLSPDSDANKIQYVEDAEYDDDFAAATQLTAAGENFAASDYYRFSIVLTNLDPDTRYFYRIGSEENWNGVKTFRTAGGEDDFSFLYLGDVQEGYDTWGNMVENIYNENPQIRFALLGGDLTTNGEDSAEWGEFLEAATGVFSRIPMMPAKGNHDSDLFFEFFALPDNGTNSKYERFYSFDYGDAHFVVLDTSNVITNEVKQWLEGNLQNTDKKWKFAVFHHPPYQNFDDNKTIDDALREHWVPILEQNQVDMVFVGHQHVYMRTHPIYQGEVAADSYGIVYVMGNSGSKFYSTGQGFPYIAIEETGSNYQIIELEDDVLTLTSRKADGELIETYILSKGWFEEQDPHYQIMNDEGDTDFTPGVTTEGIFTLTAKSGVSGFKNFVVLVTSLAAHDGDETIVFAHLRNGSQLQINSTRADFDQVTTAQAGFNVAAGDVIKIYVVDELTNADDHNPVILQH